MTRYYMPVALSEQFHAVVIMPSKDITMQDIRISKFQSDLFFAQNCLLLSSSGLLSPLLPSEESQKNLTTTSMISTTITVPVTLSLSSQEESHVRRFQPRVASPVTSVTNSLTRLATLVGVS